MEIVFLGSTQFFPVLAEIIIIIIIVCHFITIRLVFVPSFTEAILNGLLIYLLPRSHYVGHCFKYVNFFLYFLSQLHKANGCLHKACTLLARVTTFLYLFADLVLLGEYRV